MNWFINRCKLVYTYGQRILWFRVAVDLILILALIIGIVHFI